MTTIMAVHSVRQCNRTECGRCGPADPCNDNDSDCDNLSSVFNDAGCELVCFSGNLRFLVCDPERMVSSSALCAGDSDTFWGSGGTEVKAVSMPGLRSVELAPNGCCGQSEWVA
jgi:hypothetical protein